MLDIGKFLEKQQLYTDKTCRPLDPRKVPESEICMPETLPCLFLTLLETFSALRAKSGSNKLRHPNVKL